MLSTIIKRNATMKINKLMLSSALACACTFGVGAVNAGVAYGQVEQVYTYASGAYVYVSPASTWAIPGYVHFCYTTDPDLMRAAAAAVHKNVTMYCSGTFPTSGTYRNGNTITYLAVN